MYHPGLWAYLRDTQRQGDMKNITAVTQIVHIITTANLGKLIEGRHMGSEYQKLTGDTSMQMYSSTQAHKAGTVYFAITLGVNTNGTKSSDVPPLLADTPHVLQMKGGVYKLTIDINNLEATLE